MSMEFSYWYLLLVAIPLIGLSLIPYFRTAKKYRRTRNRIISLTLHCLSILLVSFALAGALFVRTTHNTANELILVVDVSDTQTEQADRRDDFIKDVLKESVYRNFTVGVVTFGLDQVFAVPLTRNINSVYETYASAPLPDTSATNIDAAIEYARKGFNHPESGKLLLITDGKETDGNVVSSTAISSVVAQGTKIDTVYVSSAYEGSEYQILDLKVPDVQVKTGTEYTLEASVLARGSGYVRIELYDNDKAVSVLDAGAETGQYEVFLTEGIQMVPLVYKFTEAGLHELRVEIGSARENSAIDTLDRNNKYVTYLKLESFKKVLVIEYYNDSENLRRMLTDPAILGEEVYDVSVYNLQAESVTHYLKEGSEEGTIPLTVDDFRQYDQVILNNISNRDLTERDVPLDKILNAYVYEYGGGMLTLGGNEPDGDPQKPDSHAYNRKDMYGSDYQKMLPIEAVDYTPPAGVFIIVDVSGSMSDIADGHTKFYWAQFGARACVDALEDRDKIGIMTLGSTYSDVLPLTPRTERQKILSAIDGIKEAYSGTVFTKSLEHAAEQLRAAKMEKNHIIIVSDGEIDPKHGEESAALARQYFNDEKLNLTVSIVLIGSSGGDATKNIVCATREAGWIDKINRNEAGCGYYPLDSSQASSIYTVLLQDLKVDAIKEVNYKPFRPVAFNKISQVVQGIEFFETEDGVQTSFVDATLGGYYGVKKKNLEGVDLVLTSESQVPIYARWKYGRGSVGSFMCNLKGDSWSLSFMESRVGKKLVYNIMDDLMPTTNIRPQEISVSVSEKNYTNHLTCPTELKEGESVRGIIRTSENEEFSLNAEGRYEDEKGNTVCIVKRSLNENNEYSVSDFLIMKDGVYTIELQKINAAGEVLSRVLTYKEFSYSKEYDVEYEKSEEEISTMLASLAYAGKGAALNDSSDVALVFRDFVTELRNVFDPRLLFILLATILFLLDVAIRKFKFKWIHEIIRERREKKAQQLGSEEERHE